MTVDTTKENAASPRTDVIDIRGRNVEVKELTDAQMALMAREVRILTRDTVDGQRKLDAIAKMFTLLESVVVKAEDREYMDDLVMQGELDLRELTSFVTIFQEDAPKPKVRRGRPPVKRS